MEVTEKQLREIKEGYFFLTEYKKLLESLRKGQLVVDAGVVLEYKKFIHNLNILLPDTLETFDDNNYLRKLDAFDFPALSESPKYRIDSLLTRVIKDLSVLNSLLEDVGKNRTPLAPKKDFSFIKDRSLREIIERDYVWINKCLAVEAWKPLIISCGGLIEAVLLDKLLIVENKAKSSSKSPKEKDLRKWSLENLLDVAVDLSIINPGAEKLGSAVRNYRNLIHPGKELRSGLQVKPEEAKISFEILNMIIRDFNKQ